MNIEPGSFHLILTSNYSIADCFHDQDVEFIESPFTEIGINVNSLMPFTVIDREILLSIKEKPKKFSP